MIYVCVVNKQLELLEFVINSVYSDCIILWCIMQNDKHLPYPPLHEHFLNAECPEHMLRSYKQLSYTGPWTSKSLFLITDYNPIEKQTINR